MGRLARFWRARRRRSRWLLAIAAGLVLATAVYLPLIRPRQLRWGATDLELARAMPGDELIADPDFDATRAVTVAAEPRHVWPWLVQMGYGRAGWYSYDLIDNLGRRSAERIVPKFQDPAVGDPIHVGPGIVGWRVRVCEPESVLLWAGAHSTWAWGLHPADDGRTRLVSRVRIRYRWLHPTILFNLLIDVGDFPMMRACLLGIRERAESLARAEAARAAGSPAEPEG